MEEIKKENKKKDKNSRLHFTKVIEYNEQTWLTDVIVGQKGSKFFGSEV